VACDVSGVRAQPGLRWKANACIATVVVPLALGVSATRCSGGLGQRWRRTARCEPRPEPVHEPRSGRHGARHVCSPTRRVEHTARPRRDGDKRTVIPHSPSTHLRTCAPTRQHPLPCAQASPRRKTARTHAPVGENWKRPPAPPAEVPVPAPALGDGKNALVGVRWAPLPMAMPSPNRGEGAMPPLPCPNRGDAREGNPPPPNPIPTWGDTWPPPMKPPLAPPAVPLGAGGGGGIRVPVIEPNTVAGPDADAAAAPMEPPPADSPTGTPPRGDRRVAANRASRL
jgi:hypothetical protein